MERRSPAHTGLDLAKGRRIVKIVSEIKGVLAKS